MLHRRTRPLEPAAQALRVWTNTAVPSVVKNERVARRLLFASCFAAIDRRLLHCADVVSSDVRVVVPNANDHRLRYASVTPRAHAEDERLDEGVRSAAPSDEGVITERH